MFDFPEKFLDIKVIWQIGVDSLIRQLSSSRNLYTASRTALEGCEGAEVPQALDAKRLDAFGQVDCGGVLFVYTGRENRVRHKLKGSRLRNRSV